MLDRTHDPQRRSWVESANDHPDFPIQNLPFGVFRRPGESWRVGTAIGDGILDLVLAVEAEALLAARPLLVGALRQPNLNALLALGPTIRRELRQAVSDLLTANSTPRTDFVVPQGEVELGLPVAVGDYTDFYASIDHATNIGSMLRPDQPLLPNYKWIPIGYHGRASSLVVSGTPVIRPSGQRTTTPTAPPVFGASERLDYEVELGMIVGSGNARGLPVGIERAGEHIAGVCLVNDWSARDMQAWEYQPLGPFLAKSFATTVSPWLVTSEALEPFRCRARVRDAGDPAPLEYLDSAADQERGALDLNVEVLLSSARMRAEGHSPLRISRGNARNLYWTPAQFVAHHTSAGCNLRVGDLLASGTISGPTEESRGCLMELTWRGTRPLTLPTGETRGFLEDGDEVVMRGRCASPDAVDIGLGTCTGTVLPARVAR